MDQTFVEHLLALGTCLASNVAQSMAQHFVWTSLCTGIWEHFLLNVAWLWDPVFLLNIAQLTVRIFIGHRFLQYRAVPESMRYLFCRTSITLCVDHIFVGHL